MNLKKFVVILSLWSMVFSLFGCDAFVRKFTRKPKKDNLPKEEMVLIPEEYKGLEMPKDELYRQYLFFWKSWQDELIQALAGGASNKKQLDCANEAMKSLDKLKPLLDVQKQKQIELYIIQLDELKEAIAQDCYGVKNPTHRMNAERLRRNILRDLSLPKIKAHLG